jgi:hypothetical protein
LFKKIEIWILYLTILFGFLFAVLFGVLVRQELVGATKVGWVSKSALLLAEIPSNLSILINEGSVLQVEDRFPDLDGFNGTPQSEESYLLLSKYDGDLAEGILELIDLTNFKVLHTWNPDINAFNDLVDKVDEFEHLERDSKNSRLMMMHPLITKKGSLLFSERGPLREINACSDLVSQNTHDVFHHSVEIDIDENIWIPSYIFPSDLPPEKVGINSKDEVRFYDDGIVQMSSDGDILFEQSVSQIFIDNGLEYLLFSVGDMHFDQDPIHLNDIQPVDSDGEHWKKGDLFLSLRHQSMVLLYRPSTNKIIWKGTGPFFHQHDVDILDDHRISIFNNNSKDFINANVVDGHNEVIIYDFNKNEYSSYLKDSLIKNDVKTITNGRSEILQNGDLFIEETIYGRSLYFNSNGSLRWTHVNRAKNGNVYYIGWSRILYTKEHLQNVNNFLENRGICNE